MFSIVLVLYSIDRCENFRLSYEMALFRKQNEFVLLFVLLFPWVLNLKKKMT